jgi:hypothetical protein
MTFKEKYTKLQDTEHVIEMITRSVYDTMCLEGQGLPMSEILEIVKKVMEEPEPKLLKAS